MINVRIRGVITLLYSGICWRRWRWRWREPPPLPFPLPSYQYMQAIYGSIMQVGVGYLAISLLRN